MRIRKFAWVFVIYQNARGTLMMMSSAFSHSVPCWQKKSEQLIKNPLEKRSGDLIKNFASSLSDFDDVVYSSETGASFQCFAARCCYETIQRVFETSSIMDRLWRNSPFKLEQKQLKLLESIYADSTIFHY